MNPCVICQRIEPGPEWTVCHGCLSHIDDDLARIVELTALAGGRLIPETRPGNGGRSVPGSRPPLSVDALDDCIGHDVLPILESWIRLIREEAALSPYGAATEAERVTVASSVAWLRSWLLWAAERPDFPLADFADEIRTITARLYRHDPNRPARPVGIPVRCTADHPDADGRGCDYLLTTNGTDTITCPRCLTRYTPDDILDPLNPTLLTADQLIVLDDGNGNPRERLRNWHKRGKIQPAAYADTPNGGRPTPLYRLGEDRTLLAAVNRLDNIVTDRAF